jgi:GT2 family glycosyltransferase
LSWNSSRHIEACLRSLAHEGIGHSDEIWVVDNGSSDGSVELLQRLERELAPTLRVIYLQTNTGTTVSRNLALRRARGAYIAIIDSDVVIAHGTVAPMIERLKVERACGLLVPRLTYPDGRSQMSTDVFPTALRKLRRLLMLKSMEKRLEGDGLLPGRRTVDYAISAFWMMRREVFEAVGLLDEKIFYSPEDVDYCLRVWHAGYTVEYDPSVQSVHCGQEVSRGFPLSRAALSHIGGLAYLFRKHRYVFSRRRLYRRLEALRARHAAQAV